MPQLRLVDSGANGGMSGHDPFQLDPGEGYSETKFYTKSTDGKGNSETKYMKLSPTILAIVGQMIARHKFPAYKTEADFIRDAVYHRLHRLAELEANGEFADMVNRSIHAAAVHAHQQDMAECSNLIQSHSDAMRYCADNKDWIGMAKALEMARDQLDDLPPAYQAKLQRVIDEHQAEIKQG